MASKFLWSDFFFPSSLKVSTFLDQLLEPVRSFEGNERIELGLHEALVNAVRHGNMCDPSKSLRVRRILTPNWLVWQVQDEGKGISKVARVSSLPPKIDSINGRGLFLIHQCFDDVRWSRRGNRLQLAARR